jgi:hypothetical protein
MKSATSDIGGRDNARRIFEVFSESPTFASGPGEKPVRDGQESPVPREKNRRDAAVFDSRRIDVQVNWIAFNFGWHWRPSDASVRRMGVLQPQNLSVTEH